jgi:Skp family chaperone for outer membrane proteins
VFKSSDKHQFPLASEAVVEAHKRAQKDIEQLKNAIDDFVNKHSTELSELLAAKTSRYMMAAWDTANGQAVDAAALKLDETTLSAGRRI